MSADFKVDKNMEEMTDLSKALDTKIENRSALALTILVGTSLLCVNLLVSRDMISLKMVSGKTRSNENVLSLSKVSLIICMLRWFLYFWIALSTGSLIFETSHNKSSLSFDVKLFDYITKKSIKLLSNLTVRGNDVIVVN